MTCSNIITVYFSSQVDCHAGRCPALKEITCLIERNRDALGYAEDTLYRIDATDLRAAQLTWQKDGGHGGLAPRGLLSAIPLGSHMPVFLASHWRGVVSGSTRKFMAIAGPPCESALLPL
jgi:hypothetical protein